MTAMYQPAPSPLSPTNKPTISEEPTMTNTEQRVTEAMAARAINWHAEQARTSAARMAAERSAVARVRWHAEQASPSMVTVTVAVETPRVAA